MLIDNTLIYSKKNEKRKIAKTLKTQFKDCEFFNIICSNVFKNFLYFGKRREAEILDILKDHTNTIEFQILYILYKYNEGSLTEAMYKNILESNIFIKNILYFISFLKKINWKDFIIIAEKLNNNNNIIDEKNISYAILDNILRILKIKKNFDLYLKGLISEGHLRLTISEYKLNNNIIYFFKKIELNKYFKINFELDLNILKNTFIDSNIGFYDSIVERYYKFSIYTTSNRNLNIYSKKRYHLYLNSKKNKGILSYAEKLAYKYLGKGLRLKYAKKWKNLRYRAYRIFLYTFKLKPFKLWQITRKSRKGRNGGSLSDHLMYYEFNIKKTILSSNFCLNLQEFNEYLKNGLICINGKIISNANYKVKPYQIIHFIGTIIKEERNRFLLNLASSFEKLIFKGFSTLFEYNFTSFCFTTLPKIIEDKLNKLAPYYTTSNSGRFGVQKT